MTQNCYSPPLQQHFLKTLGSTEYNKLKNNFSSNKYISIPIPPFNIFYNILILQLSILSIKTLVGFM